MVKTQFFSLIVSAAENQKKLNDKWLILKKEYIGFLMYIGHVSVVEHFQICR